MAGEIPSITVAEHIQELRRRIVWVVAFLLLASFVGYLINDVLIELLQRPLNEQLYYTTPAGAFSFVIKLSTIFGLIAALPVIIYQTFSFFLPVLGSVKKKHLISYVFASVALASLGILFAYLISLPAALNFLTNFGNNINIQSLITVNEYFNFVLTYLAGFAILFQLPLLILLINKIKPLQPKKLLGATKYIVLVSFIVSAIITPTPDPINQTVMAVPVILLYLSTVAILSIRSSLKGRTRTASTQTIQPKKAPQHIPASIVEEVIRVETTTPVEPIKHINNTQPRLISDFIRVPQTGLRL